MRKWMQWSCGLAVVATAICAPGLADDGERGRELDDGAKRLAEGPLNAAVAKPAHAPAIVAARPGALAWHAEFDGARAASAASGRPVLLFQLLGRLDTEHC